jgi:hypothetical protein
LRPSLASVQPVTSATPHLCESVTDCAISPDSCQPRTHISLRSRNIACHVGNIERHVGVCAIPSRRSRPDPLRHSHRPLHNYAPFNQVAARIEMRSITFMEAWDYTTGIQSDMRTDDRFRIISSPYGDLHALILTGRTSVLRINRSPIRFVTYHPARR